MKKIVFTLAALLSMTMAFAEGETNTKANVAVAGEAKKYDMNINQSSLARALNLDYNEIEAVNVISESFASDMKKAGEAQGEDRDKLYKKAIKHNLSYMHAVLSYDQYTMYLKLLNTTLNNRGLNK
jgi:Fe2+ transport system protein B